MESLSNSNIAGPFVEILEADEKPITTAIKSLFKKGDVIEVRAWDKNRNVYTGRYNYNTKLLADIKFYNDEGCDVYYVLNPVGDSHPLRALDRGGLCTWEAEIPWRRRFLLDFDPKRDLIRDAKGQPVLFPKLDKDGKPVLKDGKPEMAQRRHKVATSEELLKAFDCAYAAKTWLDSIYGFKGIVLAISGNGCHLDVPCELPNDVDSKEIVRKVQRAVSKKFGTPEVECECFPDANRLVRAYGTTNMKGTETEGRKHRQSEILIPAKGGDENPKALLLAIIRDNPIADAKVVKYGEGEGMFSRDLLYARLESWQENYVGENGKTFSFEETDRRDGFRILCPGNTEAAWPDGEQHDTVGECLNDSTIVYVENGWPRFSCRHNHCGEGAEHGKKTWKDLQDFYDKDRKFHRILEDDDIDLSIMGVEYLTNEPDSVRVQFDALGETVKPEPDCWNASENIPNMNFGEFNGGGVTVKLFTGDGQPKTNQEEPEPVIKEPVVEAQVSYNAGLVMPEDCMYGELGILSRECKTPLGLTYPTMIAAYSSKINVDTMCKTRINIYCGLIAMPESGKNVTIDRCIHILNLVKKVHYCKSIPAGDTQLALLLGDKAGKKGTAPIPGYTKMLLVNNELTDVLKKTGVDNSTLASRLCDLWDDNEFEKIVGKELVTVSCRLSWVGGIPAGEDHTERFTELFGSETNFGLYPRFLFGYANKKFKYDDWEPRPVFTKTINVNMDYAGDLPEADLLFPPLTHVTSISPEATKLFDNWNPGADNEGRLKYNCKKVALLTASGNHEKTVTAECMACAIKFMEWQVRIREMFQPGEAINVQAQFRETALRGLKTVGAEEMFVAWKRVAHDRKWGKTYGDWIVKTGIEGLVEAGELVYQTVVEDREVTENKGKVIINPALSGNARGKVAIKRVSTK